jgi:hypothetical protein
MATIDVKPACRKPASNPPGPQKRLIRAREAVPDVDRRSPMRLCFDLTESWRAGVLLFINALRSTRLLSWEVLERLILTPCLSRWTISNHCNVGRANGLRCHSGKVPLLLTEQVGKPEAGGSVLEVCVHTSANDVPPELTTLEIDGPDLDMPSVSIESLPDGWQIQLEATRDLGTAWLEKNESLLLRVPSAIVPETMNCLFNPLHRQASDLRIVEVIAYPFDARLRK